MTATEENICKIVSLLQVHNSFQENPSLNSVVVITSEAGEFLFRGGKYVNYKIVSGDTRV